MRGLFATVALAGCGPVLLGAEVGESFDDSPVSDAARGQDAGAAPTAMRPSAVDAAVPEPPFNVVIDVPPPDCDGCYRLHLEPFGGEPPYEFEWDEGWTTPERYECPLTPKDVYAIATDATGAQSQASVVRLNPREEPCPPTSQAICLRNAGLEGRAAVNIGLPGTFDIVNWLACTNPQTTNMPDVASEALTMNVPEAWLMPVKATQGTTYVAMQENEQVSQVLCNAIAGGSAELNLNFDIMRVNLPTGTAPTGTVGLEIWGGIGADCTRRELLWATPPIEAGQNGWRTECATLRPLAFMDSVFFRVVADRVQTNATYLLLDNIVPVDSCT